MKKFTFLAIFLIAMVSMALAQTNMFVWMDGIKTTYPIALVDSVTFGDDDAPIGGIGTFSVSATKQVTFSSGNLQYHPANDEWRFAENQTDYIGEANSNISSTYNGWLDLFGWSTSTTNFGVSTSTSNSDYSGSFVDWGTNQIGSDAPNTWRTLTYDEWDYLRYNRTNANDLCGVAQVNGVNGLIFLPDNWTCPAGVTFKSGFHSSFGTEYYAAYQTFTAEQWSKLEAAGVIFLPAAGSRDGSDVFTVQSYGSYWSATENYGYYAFCLDFCSYKAYMSSPNRNYGQSVRLVKDINGTTPEPPIEPQDTTIYRTVDITICENDLPYIFTGRESVIELTEAGTYTYEEIVEEDNYIYHYIYTLELQVLPSSIDTIMVEAYDSYEWHGEVYTESGTYTYYDNCSEEILQLTIIDTPTPPSEPQDTIIYIDHPTEYATICEGDEFYWRGWQITEAGTHTNHETVKDDNYTYHHIYTLELTVIPFSSDTIVVEAYDSYEWHGKVYTESGVLKYVEWCYQEILHLTIIDTPTKPEGDNCENAIQVNWNDEITICGSTDTWYAIDISGIWERGEDITTTFRNNSAETATITNASYEGCEGWQDEWPVFEVYKREVKSGEERTIVYDFDQLLDFCVNFPDDVIYLHIKSDGGCVTAPALWFWLPATEDFVE